MQSYINHEVGSKVSCLLIMLDLMQIIFAESAKGSRLLQARVKMQQRYLEQFYDLYDDFHIIQLPLLEEEVRGVDALKAFSAPTIMPSGPSFSVNLTTPYHPETTASEPDHVAELEQEVAAWKSKCEQLQRQLQEASA